MQTRCASDPQGTTLDRSARESNRPLVFENLPPPRKRRRRRSALRRRGEQIFNLRERAFTYMIRASTIALVLIFILILLQGFHVWGFNLPVQLLYALIAATIGKLAAFIFYVMRFLFRAYSQGNQPKT